MKGLNISITITALLLVLSCNPYLDVQPDPLGEEGVNLKKGGNQNSEPVFWFGDPLNAVSGSWTSLNRNPNSISTSFHMTDAIPGQAYTVWLVIFNEPGNCGSIPCAEADIFDLATKTDVTFAGGHVAGNSKLTISGSKNVGDLSGSAIPYFNQAFGLSHPTFGLTNPAGAEVHLVLRSHGPKVPANMPAQINSYVGGCSNFLDPPNLASAAGDCADTHFSIHQP